MTPDQLRALAVQMELRRGSVVEMQLGVDFAQCAAYLRACADSVPVAWRHPQGSFAGPKQVEAWGLPAMLEHGWTPLFTHPMPQEKP